MKPGQVIGVTQYLSYLCSALDNSVMKYSYNMLYGCRHPGQHV